MKKTTESINFNNIKEQDIEKWNREILEYNQTHIKNNELAMASPTVKYQLSEISSYLMNKAIQTEKIVTNDLHNILSDGAYFVELDHRFKSRERLEEKIYHRAIKDNNDLMAVGNEISDALRYTIIFDYDTYIEQVDEYLHELEDIGYKVIKFKNRWREVYFKGISVHVESFNQGKFEIQFHTKENHDIKEIFSREPYKLTRRKSAPTDLLVKAYLLRRIYQQRVHIPPYALEYQYESQKGKGSR